MTKHIKIAIILPAQYRGSTARLAESLFSSLSKNASCSLLYLSSGCKHTDEMYKQYILDILKSHGEANLTVQPFKLDTINPKEAISIIQGSTYALAKYKNLECPSLRRWNGARSHFYSTLDLGDFTSFDSIVFASHGIYSAYPVIYTSPYSVIVTDLLQRYVPEVLPEWFWMHKSSEYISCTIRQIRDADHVFCTTPDTLADVLEYAGRLANTHLIPICAHKVELDSSVYHSNSHDHPYAIWVTNASRHKNHLMMIDALKCYFEQHQGHFIVIITGVNTKLFSPYIDPSDLSTSELAIYNSLYISTVRRRFKDRLSGYNQQIIFAGEVGDQEYFGLLSRASFLIHNVIADNGTYSVVEAAQLGTPSISSDYPQMRYIAKKFRIPISFFDPFNHLSASSLIKASESLPRLQSYTLPPECDWQHVNFSEEIVTKLIKLDQPSEEVLSHTLSSLLAKCGLNVDLPPFWADYPFFNSRWIFIDAGLIPSNRLLFLIQSIKVVNQKHRKNLKVIYYSKVGIAPLFQGLLYSAGLEYSFILVDNLECSTLLIRHLGDECIRYVATMSGDGCEQSLTRTSSTHDVSVPSAISNSFDLVADLMNILGC